MFNACVKFAAVYCAANGERHNMGRPDLIKSKLATQEFYALVEAVHTELMQ